MSSTLLCSVSCILTLLRSGNPEKSLAGQAHHFQDNPLMKIEKEQG